MDTGTAIALALGAPLAIQALQGGGVKLGQGPIAPEFAPLLKHAKFHVDGFEAAMTAATKAIVDAKQAAASTHLAAAWVHVAALRNIVPMLPAALRQPIGPDTDKRKARYTSTIGAFKKRFGIK